MALEPGSRIGPYTITAPLGAGGMGEVYRASDTKLKREVAIKVLPDDLARDPERLTRFEREAQLLAALNHPNIGAIYGLEESAGAQCLILELIEGRTLAEVIPEGGMPVEQALPLALQIAEALEAAHARGIVHRDLKPANIKVTPDAVVKVLDFGLAKAFTGDPGGGSSDISMSPTLTGAATQAGVIIGTAAYMSPEQAAGQAADHRADVWSFGVVLMEMLSGKRLFDGETVSHTLASVLKEDPDWKSLPAGLPRRLRELLRRCLLKRARQRLQSIGEARIVIEEYLADPQAFDEPAPEAGTGTPQIHSSRTSLLPWAVAALLAVSLPIAIWWLRPAAAPAPPLRRANVILPEGELPFRGYGSSAVISPDGLRVAYATEGADGRSLHLRYIDQWEGTVITSAPANDGPYQPFFSPDGEWIGFVTPTELKKVSIRGGNPITLCPVDFNRGSDWGEDGRIVFAASPAGGLSVLPAAGGEPAPLTEIDEEAGEISHRWPQWLPGGNAVLFTSLTEASNFDSASLEIFEVESGERRTVQRGGSYGRYVGSGHIVYVNQGTLFALQFDAETLQAAGQAAPVIEGIASNREEGGAQYSVSDDGSLLYMTGMAHSTGSTLVWVDRQGERTTFWGQAQDYGNPTFSPDGARLAIDIESEGYRDVWIYDLTRDVPTRLTFADGDDYAPVWSPDGNAIYFASERDGVENIYRKPADGSGDAELVLKSDRISVPQSISPDGRFLTYRQTDTARPDLWILPLDGGDPKLFLATPQVDYGARFSPDGRWIVYGTNESGPYEVYVRPVSGGKGRWQISTGLGVYPQWSPDGRSIYYRTATGGVAVVSVDTEGGTFRPGRPEELFGGENLVLRGDGNHHYTVAPDGERFLMVQTTSEGSTAAHEHLQVVFNWFDELRRTFVPAAAR